MGALLPDLALVHDDDPVGILDGGKPVGHDQGGAALHELAQRILNEGLRLGVDVGGGFVQNQHGGLEGQRPCKGQQLPLSGGEGRAPLDDLAVVAVFQMGNEGVGVDIFGRLHDLLIGDALLVQPDIALHIAGEQEHILQHLPHAGAQICQPDLPHIHAVDEDLALLNVEIPADQALDGGLSRAGGAHKGHALAGLHLEGHILQHPVLPAVFVGLIGEPDIAELDMALDMLHLHGVRRVFNGGFCIHQPEDALRCRRGRLDHIEVFRQLLNGIKKAGDVPLEGHQRTDGDGAGDGQPSAVSQQDRHGGDVQQVRGGTVEGEAHELPDIGLAQLLALAFKVLLHVLLRREDLHHLHAGNMLRHKGVQLGDPGADGPVELARHPGKEEGEHHDEGDGDKQHQRQLGVLPQHDDHDAHQREHRANDVDDDGGEHLVHRFAVVGDAGHQPADGIVVEEGHVQRGQMAEDIRAQVIDDLLAHGGKDRHLHIAQHHDQHHSDEIFQAQLQNALQILAPQLLQLRQRKALRGDGLIFVDERIGGQTQKLGLVKLQQHDGHAHGQHQHEPPEIGLAVAEEPPHRMAVDSGVILFLHAHNAYSSFFIFSSSCRWYRSA